MHLRSKPAHLDKSADLEKAVTCQAHDQVLAIASDGPGRTLGCVDGREVE